MSRRESVTILRAGTEMGDYDPQGNPIIGPDTEIVSDGWLVAPRSSSESAEPYGQQVVTGLSLYRREPADVVSSDRVRVRGEVWSVDGDVADWGAGVVVNLKRGA